LNLNPIVAGLAERDEVPESIIATLVSRTYVMGVQLGPIPWRDCNACMCTYPAEALALESSPI
jgi:hypothetical protein